MYGAVRQSELDPKPGMYSDLQIALNTAMRVASGKRLVDRVSIANLSAMTKIKSFNHMAAEEMLALVWHGIKDANSPLFGTFEVVGETSGKSTRARERGDLRNLAKTSLGQRNLPHSAIQLWNQCDASLREIEAKSTAKKKIRQISSSLPL